MFVDQNGSNLVPLTMRSAVIELGTSSPGWQLDQRSDESADERRVFRVSVAFDAPFANVPMVHVALAGFDIDNCDTARLSVRAEAVSSTGFELVVATWLNTRVYKVEVSWLALGHQLPF